MKKVSRVTDWPLYHTENGAHRDDWIHNRPECVVLAKLKGHEVLAYRYTNEWTNDLSTCNGCGEYINYEGECHR